MKEGTAEMGGQPAPAQPPAPPSRWPRTFAALQYRNYRLWFFGQSISLMGMWMQSVAQGWLVYDLTGSELALGVVAFIGTAPTLLLMLPAGAWADRVAKRKLLMVTQLVMMLSALGLAALAAADVLQVWHIAVASVTLGIANSFDAPARQALAVEMVDDRRLLANAIALNSAMFNLARMVGPAIGGVVLASLGATWCFGLNGLSYIAVLWALYSMRLPHYIGASRKESLRSQIAIGVRYVLDHEVVRPIMFLLAVSSLFGFSYAVLLPAYAAGVLHAGEEGLGAMNAAVGAGALAGSLFVATIGHARRKGRLALAGAVAFPVALLAFAGASSLIPALVALVIAGFTFVVQLALSNTIVQTAVPDALRGRVMAVHSLTFFGTAPFGSLQAGALAQQFGPSAGVAVGAVITLITAVVVGLRAAILRHED